jgi:hypothetical protein
LVDDLPFENRDSPLPGSNTKWKYDGTPICIHVRLSNVKHRINCFFCLLFFQYVYNCIYIHIYYYMHK